MAENNLITDNYDCMEASCIVPGKKNLSIFIPTKDRPMQFEACLHSIVTNLFQYEKCDIFVLAKSSNEHIRTCYEDICTDYITKGYNVVLGHEKDFRQDFLNLLQSISNSHSYVMGMTDDTIFWSPYIFPLNTLTWFFHDSNIFTLSLRLGANTTIQNPDNPSERIVIPSSFYPEKTGQKIAFWNWNNRELSVNCQYPISLDGHIYRSKDLFDLSSKIPFKNLREWEGELMAYVTNKPHMTPIMCCFEQSYTVNISCNLTQFPFIEKMGPYGKSLTELQELFDSGYVVDLAETVSRTPKGSHEYFELKFHKAF